MPDDDRDAPLDRAVAVVRRAPFSDNPRVGARGQRAQQRILDAALRAFGEEGYHGCSIDRIAKLAQCSRVSFYQYFANKEDVFRHLAGLVARQVGASTEALDSLSADAQGWSAMRTWVARYASRSTRATSRCSTRSRATRASRDGRARHRRGDGHADPRAVGDGHAGAAAARPRHPAPAGVPEPHVGRERDPPRVGARRLPARTDRDRLHRCPAPHAVRTRRRCQRAPVGGSHAAGTGVRTRDVGAAPRWRSGRAGRRPRIRRCSPCSPRAATCSSRAGTRRPGSTISSQPPGCRTGAFYRYFRNKEELARILTARAVRAVGATVTEIPDLTRGRRLDAQERRATVAAPLPRGARGRGRDAPGVGRCRTAGPGDPGRVGPAARLGPTAHGAVPASTPVR